MDLRVSHTFWLECVCLDWWWFYYGRKIKGEGEGIKMTQWNYDTQWHRCCWKKKSHRVSFRQMIHTSGCIQMIYTLRHDIEGGTTRIGGVTQPKKQGTTKTNVEDTSHTLTNNFAWHMLFLLQQNTGFWVPFLRDRRPVYYEQQVKRELKRVHISGYRCNERLKAETDGSKRLTYTGLRGDLEHLTIETRLISESFECVMGECVI